MKAWTESKFFNISDATYKENQNCFLDLVPENPKAKLLDIGCNDGTFTMKIARKLKTEEVYGVEIDPYKGKMAQDKGIKVTMSDLNKPLPFCDNIFDVITSNQAIEHLYNQDTLFKEIHRILNRGGQLLISTQNLCSWHNIVFMILGMQPPGFHLCRIQMGNFLRGVETHGHIKLFSLKALKDIAHYYGFRTFKIAAAGYYPFRGRIATTFSSLDKNHAVYITILMQKR